MSDDPTTVTSTAPPAKAASGGRWVNVLLGVAAVVAIGGVAFAIGRTTAPAATAAGFPTGGFPGVVGDGTTGAVPGGSFDPGAFPLPSGAPMPGPGAIGLLGSGGLTVEGVVESVTADSITITTADGDSVTLALDADTAWHAQAPAVASDVTAGSSVALRLDMGELMPGGAGGAGGGGAGGAGGAGPLGGTVSDVTIVAQ